MYWVITAWLITVISAFALGYWHRNVEKKLEAIEQKLTMKADIEVKQEEPKSTILDPDDAIQQAIWERDEMQKKLNQ